MKDLDFTVTSVTHCCYDVMDELNRPPPSNGRAPACSPANDSSAEIWHSTPVKKKNGGASLDVSHPSLPASFSMNNGAKQWSTSSPPVPTETLHHPNSQDTKFSVSELSGSTVQRQRRELQLLMAELKDRDMELNTMAASHRKQFHAWEQERQRVLSLEQRCARLHDGLQKRNEVIRVLTKRVCVVETREDNVQKELGAARQQICELQEKQQHINQKWEDFEEKNQSLNSTIMALSSQVGSLQVREEELSSMLKLKDEDVTEASSRLRDLEAELTESRSRENKLLRDAEEVKRRYKEAKHEITHLKEVLRQQVAQSSSQREELIRLKQELQLLRQELTLSDGDGWKDELLELARSKQERNMSELHCLRQVCENQKNDLQLLQLNLESALEALREKNSQRSAGSQDEFKCCCPDRHSPSSHRVKNSGLFHETVQSSTVNSGVFSAHLLDDDKHLSSCALQQLSQLLEESRQVIKTSIGHSSSSPHCSVLNSGPGMSCGTPDSLQTAHHQQPTSPTYKQASETPPRGCGLQDASRRWTT